MVQTVGFLLLLLGNLTYSEIIVIKCCNMDYYLLRNIEARKVLDDVNTNHDQLLTNDETTQN